MASYPKDRFDNLPADLQRIGAHRAPAVKGRGWVGFAWAALATGVLVFAGVFGLSRFLGVDIVVPIFDAAPSATPTPTPTPTADPVLDATTIDPARNILITVLNGTETPDLQNAVGDSLASAGWNVNSRGATARRDVPVTTVYYSDPANEDVARGVVLALGSGGIRLVAPEQFPGAPITVVIGADFPGATPAA